MPLEVACPTCGAKLKAPENMVGKKAKCKKCDAHFRIPGPASPGDSVGETNALSVSGEDDVPMAAAADGGDPFDFAAPAAPAPAPKPAPKPAPAPKPTSPPAAAAAPARPAFGSAKPAAPAKPSAKPAAPVAKAAPAKLPPPVVDDEPHELPELPAPKPVAKAKPAPEPEPEPAEAEETAPADPFAFNFAGAAEPEPRDRDRREDDDRDRRHKKDRDDEDDEPRSKRKGRDRDEEEDDRKRKKERGDGEPDEEGRRYLRPDERKSGKSLMVALILGLLAIGAAVAAVVVFTQRNKERDEAKNKKEEKKVEEPPVIPPVVTPPVVEPPKKEPPKKEPEKKDTTPPKKETKDPDPMPKKEPPKKEPDPVPSAPAGPALALGAKVPTFAMRPIAAKPAVVQKPSGMPTVVDAPFDKVRRVFAPENPVANDSFVVWTPGPGKANVEQHSGSTGAKVGRFEYDGDGTKCDVSPDGKQFIAAGTDGKVTVWNLADRARVLDAFDPYSDKPEHKKAGVGAVYFTKAPNVFLVVSTAGAVHQFDVVTKKPGFTFTPPGAAVAGRVLNGKSAAADAARASVVLAVGGSVFQLDSGSLAVAQKIELGGEVARPLGIAVVGNPGRVTYAFETFPGDPPKGKGPAPKAERGMVFSLPNGKAEFTRWPDAAGEPSAVDWIGSEATVITTAKGAVWAEYDTDIKRFVPLALAEVPGGKAVHAATEKAHWYLVPSPGEPTKSLLVELGWPPEGLLEFRNAVEARNPLYTVRLDDKGLSK